MSCSSDCHALGLTSATRPAPHWDATFLESPSTGASKVWTLHVGESFFDQAAATDFYRHVETLFHEGVTAGCGPGAFCPAGPVTRGQMARWMLRAKLGASYSPPSAAGVFADVPAEDPDAPFIEDLYGRGLVDSCGSSPARYCPDDPLTRRQVAAFILRVREGNAWAPAAAIGFFGDVPPENVYALFIEDLFNRGAVGACILGDPPFYCPDDVVTRQQMAHALVGVFGLQLHSP